MNNHTLFEKTKELLAANPTLGIAQACKKTGIKSPMFHYYNNKKAYAKTVPEVYNVNYKIESPTIHATPAAQAMVIITPLSNLKILMKEFL